MVKKCQQKNVELLKVENTKRQILEYQNLMFKIIASDLRRRIKQFFISNVSLNKVVFIIIVRETKISSSFYSSKVVL